MVRTSNAISGIWRRSLSTRTIPLCHKGIAHVAMDWAYPLPHRNADNCCPDATRPLVGADDHHCKPGCDRNCHNASRAHPASKSALVCGLRFVWRRRCLPQRGSIRTTRYRSRALRRRRKARALDGVHVVGAYRDCAVLFHSRSRRNHRRRNHQHRRWGDRLRSCSLCVDLASPLSANRRDSHHRLGRRLAGATGDSELRLRPFPSRIAVLWPARQSHWGSRRLRRSHSRSWRRRRRNPEFDSPR